METSINLRINAGQAKSEAEAVRQSVERVTESLEKLKEEGNWGGAADAIRKQQEAQSASLQQQAGYSAGGASSAGYAGAGSTAQALKSLEMRIETLTRVSEDLTRQLEKAAEGGDTQASFNLSSTLNNVEQERRQLLAEKARTDSKQADDGGGSGGMERALKAFNISQLMGYAVSISGIYSGYRQSMARGDYIGAEAGARSGAGSMLMGAGGALAMLLGGPVGWIGGGLAALVGGSQKLKSDWLETKNAEAQNYLGKFTPASMVVRGFENNYYKIDPLKPETTLEDGRKVKNWINNIDEDAERYKQRELDLKHNKGHKNHLDPYGGELPEYLAGRHGHFDNTKAAENLMEAAARKVKGLEISIPELLQMAKDQAVYGATSQTAALNQASKAAHFVQSTGTDAGTAAAFVGLMARFGLHREDESGLEDATRTRRMQGMAAAQSDEFLTGLQRVIEEGIANGYVRSAQDVGQTLSMFYRLASEDDKKLWQGKYGADSLSKMNAGIAGATGLGSSSDVMAFGAAQQVLGNVIANMTPEEMAKKGFTGTYTDVMRILEKGVDADLFYAIMEEIEKLEGGNTAAIEERIRQIFGVNYTQAGQIRGMWNNRWYQDKNGNWIEKTKDELKDEYNEMAGGVTVHNSVLNAENDAKTAIDAAEGVKGADSMRVVLENLFGKAEKALEKVEENSNTWLDKVVGVITSLENTVANLANAIQPIIGWVGGAKPVLSGEKTIADLFDKRSDEEKREDEISRIAERTERLDGRSDKDIESLAHSASMNVDMGLFGMKPGDHSGALSSLLQHSRIQALLEENPALAAALTPGNENYQHELFLKVREDSLEDHYDKRDAATGAHKEVSLEKLIATLEELIKSFNVVTVETPG